MTPPAGLRAVAVDWSGAVRGEDRHLWVAEVDVDADRVVALAPATRAEAVRCVLDAAEAGPLLVGLDFSFSLPAWWLAANGIGTVDELWADADRLEGWLRECRPPFWGRPGRGRPGLGPEREFRRTELAASRRPSSTFQVGGAGSVGTGSLRGMPHLAVLRAAGVNIWPWDHWAPPVAAEVWPRLDLGGVVKSAPHARSTWVAAHRDRFDGRVAADVLASDDALDAVVAALALGRRAPQARPSPSDPVVLLEGWIDGVAYPPTGPGHGA